MAYQGDKIKNYIFGKLGTFIYWYIKLLFVYYNFKVKPGLDRGNRCLWTARQQRAIASETKMAALSVDATSEQQPR